MRGLKRLCCKFGCAFYPQTIIYLWVASGVTAFKQIMRTLIDLRRLLVGKKFVLVVLAIIGSGYAYRYVR